MNRDKTTEPEIEDLGVFEWIDAPGEAPALVAGPRAYIRSVREKLRHVPPRPLTPVDYRVRWEMPGVMLWLALSGLLQGAVVWTALGLAMLAFASWMRPALQRRSIVSLSYIYAAMGVGQLLAVAAQFSGSQALTVALAVYALALITIWIALEMWYLILSPDELVGTDYYL